jgi:hypothetical protein
MTSSGSLRGIKQIGRPQVINIPQVTGREFCTSLSSDNQHSPRHRSLSTYTLYPAP